MKRIVPIEELAKSYGIQTPSKDYDKLVENAYNEFKINVPVPPFIIELQTNRYGFEFYFYKSEKSEFDKGYVDFPNGIAPSDSHDGNHGGIKKFVNPKNALDFLLKEEERIIEKECISAIISAGTLENIYEGPLKMEGVGYNSPNFSNSTMTRDSSRTIGLLYVGNLLRGTPWDGEA